MKRGWAVWIVLFAGCAEPTNREACRAYYEALVDLDCVGEGDFDADARCPPELDDDPCPLASFYECRAEEATCTGGQLELGDPEHCTLACPSS